MDCPISRAKRAVPRPTRPPRAHPATRTRDSIPRRTRPTRMPVRWWIPVIQPSRGPGPNPQVMYKDEAIPTRMIPERENTKPAKKLLCLGNMSTPICSAKAIMMMLRTVPNPGFSLRGIHSKSTTQLIRKVAHPRFIPVLRDIPSASTTHGEFPRRDCTSNDSPRPKRNSAPVRIETRNGARSHREFALHGVIGIDRCGRNHSIKRRENSEGTAAGYLICLMRRLKISLV